MSITGLERDVLTTGRGLPRVTVFTVQSSQVPHQVSYLRTVASQLDKWTPKAYDHPTRGSGDGGPNRQSHVVAVLARGQLRKLMGMFIYSLWALQLVVGIDRLPKSTFVRSAPLSLVSTCDGLFDSCRLNEIPITERTTWVCCSGPL